MSRYRGPRNRLARREGVDLGLKTPGSSAHKQLLKRLKIVPGQHGQKNRRKSSDYGVQLREKQKVKRMYGVTEYQFRRYFERASKQATHTGESLLSSLECRLDNVVYRLKLAPTRFAARQFVSHGHVAVDGKRVTIPSFFVEEGMVITPREKILNTPLVKKMLEEQDPVIPTWLTRKGPIGKVLGKPKRDDITEDINEQLIIEFYSR